MGCLEGAFREVHHIEHIGCEAETIAKLLDGDGCAYIPEIFGLDLSEIAEGEAGESHACGHHPQRFAEAHLGGVDAPEDAADGEEEHADGAVDDADVLSGERKAAHFLGGNQERSAHLDEESLGQAIEEHEGDGEPKAFFLEESGERVAKLLDDLHGARSTLLVFRDVGFVACGLGKGEGVVEGDGGENEGGDHHRDFPRHGDVAGLNAEPAYAVAFNVACDIDEDALAEDRRETIEGGADAHKSGLVLGGEGQHVEAVGGDVVGGRSEGGQHEEEQREGEQADGGGARCYFFGAREGDGEDEEDERQRHQGLHGENPPALGADDVDKGAPEGLYHPGEVEEACEESHLAVGDTHLGKHQHGDVVDDKVGYAFGEV